MTSTTPSMPTRGDALCDGHRRAHRRAHIEVTDVCPESSLALEPEDAQWYVLRALQSGAACQILGTRKSTAPAWPYALIRTVTTERLCFTSQSAWPGDFRSMAPSKRRKTAAPAQPISGNATQGVRTRRSSSARGDVPDAPDADLADLDAEPEVLLCPITRVMFRDPVMVVDSGHTYERSAILSHFERNGAKDPLTRRALSSTKVMTIWVVRQIVRDWLDKHPGVTPDGWDSRELLEPSEDDGTNMMERDDVGVLRAWRAMCPELQGRWRRTSNRRIGKGWRWKTAGW